MGLVLWIATFVYQLEDIFGYIDDAFSWDLEGHTLLYEPYNKTMPAKQAHLLQLWDTLGIPHEESKQMWGSMLTIIGFEVDPNAMTISMPLQACTNLINKLHEFAHPNQWYPLHEFNQLAGWMNWALNAYPLLCSGLSTLYNKMSGKSQSHQPVHISTALCRELLWFAEHIKHSNGICILSSLKWSADNADFVAYSDACPSSMGFWIPSLSLGFQCQTDRPSSAIFYLEALTLLSGPHWIVTNICPQCSTQIVLYTDNSNTVSMFNTLHAQPSLYPILLTAVDLTLNHNVHFCVFHIPGEQNTVADALSCFHNQQAINTAALTSYTPLHISLFQPPCLMLGAELL
ncbi:hypothetical protein BDQ12DRAFT_606353 [Crucibulum laeve]|uniref:Uncharacterized protein n=1 Tax=Crucibulum laeve TaxID=68775 RepID=A0A5C3LYI2_9AGAR|nr:hypothetical protein BDQ12DRAFT_606353 [Crucibulum laeve]